MIDSVHLLTLLSSLVATLFAILIMLLAWLGNGIYKRLDGLSAMLHTVEGELHERVSNLDRRITRIEAICDTQHGGN